MLEDYNYVALNTGRPTYQKFRGAMSHIHLASVNSNIAAKCNWSVLNNTMGTEHCPTVCTYNKPIYSETTGIPRWKFELADWQKYKYNSCTLITSDLTTANVECFNNMIIEAISTAAQSSIPLTSEIRK